MEKNKQEEQEQKQGLKPIMLEPKSLLNEKLQRKGESEGGFSFYRKWGWVPQLNKLVGLKTWVSGPRMNLMKKKEMFNEIPSFQKVSILRVSETLKIVSRFCVKRLFYPYHWQSRV